MFILTYYSVFGLFARTAECANVLALKTCVMPPCSILLGLSFPNRRDGMRRFILGQMIRSRDLGLRLCHFQMCDFEQVA